MPSRKALGLALPPTQRPPDQSLGHQEPVPSSGTGEPTAGVAETTIVTTVGALRGPTSVSAPEGGICHKDLPSDNNFLRDRLVTAAHISPRALQTGPGSRIWVSNSCLCDNESVSPAHHTRCRSCRPWSCRGTRNQAPGPFLPQPGPPLGAPGQEQRARSQTERRTGQEEGSPVWPPELRACGLGAVWRGLGVLGQHGAQTTPSRRKRGSQSSQGSAPAGICPTRPSEPPAHTLQPAGPASKQPRVPICWEDVNLARPLTHSLTALEPVGVNYTDRWAFTVPSRWVRYTYV